MAAVLSLHFSRITGEVVAPSIYKVVGNIFHARSAGSPESISICRTSIGLCRCALSVWCASGCVVECRICNREVVGSNLGPGYFAPRSTQHSIPPGSVNEYQLRLGRQRQVWLIPIADERVGVQVKL